MRRCRSWWGTLGQCSPIPRTTPANPTTTFVSALNVQRLYRYPHVQGKTSSDGLLDPIARPNTCGGHGFQHMEIAHTVIFFLVARASNLYRHPCGPATLAVALNPNPSTTWIQFEQDSCTRSPEQQYTEPYPPKWERRNRDDSRAWSPPMILLLPFAFGRCFVAATWRGVLRIRRTCT
jgi:hypothetical protein